MELHYLLELATLVRSREVSPVEITRAQLERIQRIDNSLRSYARIHPDLALESARQAEAEIVAGRYRGPLHGVPIALKDLFWINGYPSAAGTAIHRDFRAREDATVIRRLKVAGAILLGSLQLTEGAYAAHLPPIRPPVNPWNANYWSGASSSGSGVAIAAGLCYGSLGTETGGSIHLPSAANGVTGLKPTWGRVSRHGVFELAATLDHVGPFARSAADLGALLSIVAGPDPQDPTAARHPLSDYAVDTKKRLPKIRIGLDARYAFQGVDQVTVEAVSGAIETMRALGAEIVDIKFPAVDGMVADWFPLCAVQTAVAHEGTYPSRKE
jgi:amidase